MAAYRLLLLLLLIQVAVAFDQCLIHHIDVVSYKCGVKIIWQCFFPYAMPGYLNWVYCIALDDPPSGDVVT